jgi:hypothetical protein
LKGQQVLMSICKLNFMNSLRIPHRKPWTRCEGLYKIGQSFPLKHEFEVEIGNTFWVEPIYIGYGSYCHVHQLWAHSICKSNYVNMKSLKCFSFQFMFQPILLFQTGIRVLMHIICWGMLEYTLKLIIKIAWLYQPNLPS